MANIGLVNKDTNSLFILDCNAKEYTEEFNSKISATCTLVQDERLIDADSNEPWDYVVVVDGNTEAVCFDSGSNVAKALIEDIKNAKSKCDDERIRLVCRKRKTRFAVQIPLNKNDSKMVEDRWIYYGNTSLADRDLADFAIKSGIKIEIFDY